MISEPIRGFESPVEFERFRAALENDLRTGLLDELDPNPEYQSGQIYGGRWFRSRQTGEVWRLVAPDYPFRGLWEPVLVSK